VEKVKEKIAIAEKILGKEEGMAWKLKRS